MRARFMERNISSEGVEGILLVRWKNIYLIVDELVSILNLFQFGGMVNFKSSKRISNLNLLEN